MVDKRDERDREIIAELQRDGRKYIRALAEKLHISRAHAYARVRRLTDCGVIRGFRANVDAELLGMGTSAYITLNITQVQWCNVRESLHRIPGVSHLTLVGRVRRHHACAGKGQRGSTPDRARTDPGNAGRDHRTRPVTHFTVSRRVCATGRGE